MIEEGASFKEGVQNSGVNNSQGEISQLQNMNVTHLAQGDGGAQAHNFLSQISSTSNVNTSHIKSLHMPLRKREANRIDEENQKMIERIMNAGSTMPIRQLEKDYQNHLGFKKIIQRSNPLPVEKLIQKKQKILGSVESQLFNQFPAIEAASNEKKQRSTDKMIDKPNKSEGFALQNQRAASEIKTTRNHSGRQYATQQAQQSQLDDIEQRQLPNSKVHKNNPVFMSGARSILKNDSKLFEPSKN